MRYLRIKYIAVLVAISSMLVLSASYAGAASLQFTANENGLQIAYDLKKLGSDSVSLSPGEAEEELVLDGILGRFVRLRVRVTAVAPDDKIPNVKTVFKVFLTTGQQFELPVPLPFGDYGIELGLFKKNNFAVRGADLELSLQCALRQTDYVFNIALPPYITDNLAGTATMGNNVINKEVLITLADQSTRRLDLKIIPVKTIPITFFVYTIDVYDQNNSLLKTLSGMIPLPNGSYHIWMDFGFDIARLFQGAS